MAIAAEGLPRDAQGVYSLAPPRRAVKMFFALGSHCPPFIAAENDFNGREQIQLGELLVGALPRTVADEAEEVLGLEPGGDLFHGILLQVVGQRGLACGWCLAKRSRR
jgi:hypothetical protein